MTVVKVAYIIAFEGRKAKQPGTLSTFHGRKRRRWYYLDECVRWVEPRLILLFSYSLRWEGRVSDGEANAGIVGMSCVR